MKILIVGNGGREHALLWKLRRDAPDAEFFVTRGNGGTVGLATRSRSAPTRSRRSRPGPSRRAST
jgi:phosphoribosylamine-glycine ligase